MKKEIYIKIMIGLSLGATLVQAETFTDKQTKLMWQDDPSVKTTSKNWGQAIEHCKKLSHAGYNDWRLPKRLELHSITDKTKYNPAVKSGIKNVASDYYWSSSPVVSDPSIAWRVHFEDGSGDGWYGRGGADLVRCVRDSK